MKPLLASIVLLLLALCRSSTGLSYKIVSQNSQSTKSAVSFAPPEKRAEVEKGLTTSVKASAPGVTDEQALRLLSAMGNFPFFLAFGDVLNHLPYLYGALANGLFCEAEDPAFLTELDNALDAILSRADQAEAFKVDKESPMDCDKDIKPKAKPGEEKASEALFNCFCGKGGVTVKHSALSCAVYAIRKATEGTPNLVAAGVPKKCLKQALDGLRTAGTGTLAKHFILDTFGSSNFEKEFGGKDVGGVTNNEDVESAKLFCDATTLEVENAVKEVYAADGLYWIVESLLYSIIFGTPSKPLPEICKDPFYQDNDYGKCVCKLDTGFTFCIYKVFGQFFKDKGYLSCEASEKAYVKEKKPDALPVLAHKGAAPSSTTTSSLLMAPLMAAAALLARL